MKFNFSSIFKSSIPNQRKPKTGQTLDASKPAQTETAPEKPGKKKQEYTTKTVIAAAEPFLDALLQEQMDLYPLQISLRHFGGGACWQVRTREELLSLRHYPDLRKSKLICLRSFQRVLFVEFDRKGFCTVDKKWLPKAGHRAELSEEEVKQLWKLFAQKIMEERVSHSREEEANPAKRKVQKQY